MARTKPPAPLDKKKEPTSLNKKKEPSSPKSKGKKKQNNQPIKFNAYIYRILKQVHENKSITVTAMNVMNSLVIDIFERLLTEASRLTTYRKRNTLLIDDAKSATKLLLHGELAKHANSEAYKALETFKNNDSKAIAKELRAKSSKSPAKKPRAKSPKAPAKKPGAKSSKSVASKAKNQKNNDTGEDTSDILESSTSNADDTTDDSNESARVSTE